MLSLISRESFLIGQKRQKRLSGYGYIDVGLPPASPASSNDVMVCAYVIDELCCNSDNIIGRELYYVLNSMLC